MSDTQYSTVAAKFRRLDKVDDDWMKDMLSDDEIELPKNMKDPTVTEDDDAVDDKTRMPAGWTDLSLESFLNE